jgi:glycosyltransferase involved in cell wall biosynthesis
LAAAATEKPIVRNRIVRNIPRGRLLTMPLIELGARALASAMGAVGGPAPSLYDALFIGHDAAVSWIPWPRDTGLVYAYEDGALSTFDRAARQGLPRVWDLPLPHYLTIEQIWQHEARRWPDAIDFLPHREPMLKKQRKDAELALATQVIIASAFTRESLDRIDIRVPVSVIPYGFPVEAFDARTSAPAGKFTVMAVGTHDLRKGTPYLLEAWRRAAIPDAELHLIGPLRLARSFLERYAGLFLHRPHVPKANLGALYAAADLVAFPTLGDGFGLVIQEAMSCGTPVVTTPCGGGPECIDDNLNGWLVPPRSIDALVERFRWCAANRDRTFEVGRQARKRAEQWTWREAGELLARTLPA